jgi:hypothetical protein
MVIIQKMQSRGIVGSIRKSYLEVIMKMLLISLCTKFYL